MGGPLGRGLSAAHFGPVSLIVENRRAGAAGSVSLGVELGYAAERAGSGGAPRGEWGSRHRRRERARWPPGFPTAPRPPPSPLQAVQQQRGYADAAVATKANIWDELGELVTSDEGKRELATLRSTYADISQKLAKLAAVSTLCSNWNAGRAAWAGVWAGAASGGGRWRAPRVLCLEPVFLAAVAARRTRSPSTGRPGARRSTPSWCRSSSRRTRVSGALLPCCDASLAAMCKAAAVYSCLAGASMPANKCS